MTRSIATEPVVVVVFDDGETWSEASGCSLRVVTAAALLLASSVGKAPPGDDIPLLSVLVRPLPKPPR